MKKFLIIFPILILLAALPALGQFTPSTQSFNLKLTPEFPEPSSEVRASLQSFTFDANRAEIQWFLNGRVISQGTGAKEVSFKIGALGSTNILKVIIRPQGGNVSEKTIEIIPSAIDMLVESRSFIPAWYKGAALVTSEASAKVAAIPHFIFEGRRLDPRTLIYDWRVDNEVRGDLSGRGKESILLRLRQGGTSEISVKVSSPLGTLTKEARTLVETQNPEILFYERRALEGLVTSQAIFARNIPAGGEFEVQAVPFYMNSSSLSGLQFNWSFNGAPLGSDPTEPNIFVVRSETGTIGDAVVSLVINNLRSVLEEIRASFNVHVE